MTIDLNADLGEGAGNDSQLMPYLSSCNIACGVHAGAEETIKQTIGQALKNNVKIGAHPSFPDRKNFGRIPMEMPEEELRKSIVDQVQRVKDHVEKVGGRLHHVKPHGALYNLAAVREDIAQIILNTLYEFDSLILYAPFGSVISNLAKKEGIVVHDEVFADRNYNDDLTLVSRTDSKAILYDPAAIVTHVIRMVKDHSVKTISGKLIPIKADTVCIHGDNPHAVEILTFLHSKLKDAEIEVW